MCIDEIITNYQRLTTNDQSGYILYPNRNYTPITDTLPDGTIVAYDDISDLWASQDMRIYAKSATGAWIKKTVAIWENFVPKPNNHSDYPHVAYSVHRAHWVVARAWLGNVPEGWEIDHIDGNNRNYNLSNLRLLPEGMNHRDGGFITKLRNKKINPSDYARPFLLRFFKRMAEFKATNTETAYKNLSHDDLLRLLVEPEFTVVDPHALAEREPHKYADE